MTPREFVELLRSGKAAGGPIQGLCGRLIRGKTPDDFRTLSNDPTRQLVLLIDSDGLADLVGKTGYEMLRGIGYEHVDIDTEVTHNGNRFQLVVFPEGSVKLGHWRNIIAEASAAYPEAAAALAKWENDLARLSVDVLGWDDLQARFSELEAEHLDSVRHLPDFGNVSDWNDVRRAGSSHPGYMTTERLLRSSQTLADVRAWAFFTLHLRRLYGGNGYTYDATGAKGPREWAIRNTPVVDLGDHATLNLDVQMPSKAPVHPPGSGLKVHVVIIDPQFDFCDPKGALFVSGADADARRAANFVRRAAPVIDDISVTLDSHQRLHIAHPEFVVDQKGAHPDPFTVITYAEAVDGRYRATNPNLQTYWLSYLKALADNDRYPYCIWPPHCLIGKPGQAVMPELMEALDAWALSRFGVIDWLTKGSSWKTEHYSAVRADVPDPDDPTTQLNMRFIRPLEEADFLIWLGQASSHCVPNTYIDTADAFSDPGAIAKMLLLEDCTSPVPGFEKLADDAVRDMAARGMRTMTADAALRELGV